jgi:hypothetical protein
VGQRTARICLGSSPFSWRWKSYLAIRRETEQKRPLAEARNATSVWYRTVLIFKTAEAQQVDPKNAGKPSEFPFRATRFNTNF